jgi:hypothetical protein
MNVVEESTTTLSTPNESRLGTQNVVREAGDEKAFWQKKKLCRQ